MLTPKFGSISPAAMRITAIRNAKTLIEISESKPPLPGESKETYVSRLLADNKASKHFRSIQIQAIIDELQLVDGKLSLITITRN